MWLRALRLGLPSRPFETLVERRPADSALGGDHAVNQHDGDAPVIEAKEFVIGVDINQQRVEPEVAEEG